MHALQRVPGYLSCSASHIAQALRKSKVWLRVCVAITCCLITVSACILRLVAGSKYRWPQA